MNQIQNRKLKAFISCSLRPQDEYFVDSVYKILLEHNIQPVGTVGKYSAAPENPAQSIKRNIANSDILVVCATKRYFQEDVHTGRISSGLSEMIHVESGIAYALNKPVIVFAENDINVGSFLPKITQYFFLDERSKIEKLIASIFYNAKEQVRNNFQKQLEINKSSPGATLGKVVIGGLALYGLYSLLKE